MVENLRNAPAMSREANDLPRASRSSRFRRLIRW